MKKMTPSKQAKDVTTKKHTDTDLKRYLGSLSEDFQQRLDGHAKQSERNIGALSEDFQHKVSAIGEQFGGLHKKLDEHGKILNEHGKILNEHGKILGEHSRILNSHTQMIGQLMTDVQEIKSDLKQKVDRIEFARLEKRVLAIETREYMVKSKK